MADEMFTDPVASDTEEESQSTEEEDDDRGPSTEQPVHHRNYTASVGTGERPAEHQDKALKQKTGSSQPNCRSNAASASEQLVYHDNTTTSEAAHAGKQQNCLNSSTATEGAGRPPVQPQYRATMVWDGYLYSRERIGKKCSWWRCRKNRPRDRATRRCYARGTYTYADQWFAVTVKHSHATESSLPNYVPAPCGTERSKRDSDRAVQGFVWATDQRLLQGRGQGAGQLVVGAAGVEKRHRCELCGLRFAIARVLEAHKMLEHQVRAQCTCSQCGMQFLQPDSHDKHLRICHPPPDADFSSSSSSIHPSSPKQPQHHPLPHTTSTTSQPLPPLPPPTTNKFETISDNDDKITPTTTDTTKHPTREERAGSKSKKKHGGGEGGPREKNDSQRHKCEYCPAQFQHPSKLREHTRKHTGEKPYKCSLCPRTFISGSRRGAHFKSHFKVRSHLCDWCGKKFTKHKILVEHVRTHTGEKPYACSVCARQFRKRNALMVHLRQHTGEKPYVCDQCGQSFTVKVSLRAHLKSKHDIVVTSDLPKRQVPDAGGDYASIPNIGRPKKTDAEKQLFSAAHRANGHGARGHGRRARGQGHTVGYLGKGDVQKVRIGEVHAVTNGDIMETGEGHGGKGNDHFEKDDVHVRMMGEGYMRGDAGLMKTGEGHMMRSEGHVVRGEGHVIRGEGHVVRGEGHMMGAEGYVVRTEGHVMRGEGHVMRDESHVMRDEGHVMRGEGHVIRDEGHVMRGEGHVMRAEGHMQLNNGVAVTSHPGLEMMGGYGMLPLPSADAVTAGAFFSIPQF